MTDTSKIAFLFPGQGSQYVGMGGDFLAQDADAVALMQLAESVSGFPLRRLCLEGPPADLTRTAHLQPALTVVNLICWQALCKAGIRPGIIAGHSLGEYSGLCAAGVLSPSDTLALVTERGRLMEREGTRHPGSMLAVLGLTLEEVEAVLAGMAAGGPVVAANHNAAKQIVISGAEDGLDLAAAAVAERGGKAIRLQVSGANHSPLLAGAVPDFEQAMAAIPFQRPQVPLLFNVTAGEERNPDGIRRIMASQIASRVRWYEIMQELQARDVRVFIEVGPKTVLSGLLKKNLPREYSFQNFQVDTPQSLDACMEAINKSV